ncbi:hypothetical protein [Thalassoglobus sp.]|uniref:hypothetical protein n=1 Tax=Thalassoglobus sp. TaxID=2795869 RepID=UPI003AA8D751
MPETNLNQEKTIATILLGLMSWLFLCSFTMADPDLWGHTLYGIRAIEQGVLTEATDPFSFTAAGDRWVNHEWATEYEFGGLWTQFGNHGLLLWKYVILTLLSIMLTWSLCRSDSNLGARVMLVTFTTLCLGNFMVYIRPQLVTFLFFPLVLIILRTAWERPTRLIWSLPVLTMVWVNHHGGFLAGIALIGFYAVMAWGRAVLQKKDFRLASQLSAVCGLSILSTLITPYGIELHSMLVTHLGTEQLVREWQSVFQVGFSWVYVAPFLILAFAFGVGRNWKWIDFFTMAVIAAQAVMHLRHIALLCLAEVVFLPAILTDALQRTFPHLCQRWGAPESFRLRQAGVAASIFFLFLLGLRGATPIVKAGLLPTEIVVETTSGAPGMPTRAVRFLNDNEIFGNILTDYGWAQFVIWQTFPESRVAFDGRYRTVYNPTLEADFLEFQRSGQTLPLKTPFLDQYPTQIVLLSDEAGPVSYLEKREDWQLLYTDGQARIYVKSGFLSASKTLALQVNLPKKSGLDWEIFPTDRITGTKIAE